MSCRSPASVRYRTFDDEIASLFIDHGGKILQSAWSLTHNLDNPRAHGDSGLAETTVIVRPREIKDVLYNPGMGLADFHFGFGHPPSTDHYPQQTVAYFRWSWADHEPEEGHYAFGFVDRVIQLSKAQGAMTAPSDRVYPLAPR